MKLNNQWNYTYFNKLKTNKKTMSKIHIFKKFKFVDVESDMDYHLTERTLEGRLTPIRYKTLTKFVKKWNYTHEAPYGFSPNGYAYRCGCEHDCCGCLVGESMAINFNKITESLYKITIQHSASFNY